MHECHSPGPGGLPLALPLSEELGCTRDIARGLLVFPLRVPPDSARPGRSRERWRYSASAAPATAKRLACESRVCCRRWIGATGLCVPAAQESRAALDQAKKLAVSRAARRLHLMTARFTILSACAA
jgi:hypothetical protein